MKEKNNFEEIESKIRDIIDENNNVGRSISKTYEFLQSLKVDSSLLITSYGKLGAIRFTIRFFILKNSNDGPNKEIFLKKIMITKSPNEISEKIPT